MLSSTLNQRLAQDMKIVNLDGFDSVQEKISGIAKQRPEWFPQGFNGIHAVSNAELFAGFDRNKGVFYLSAADELVSGFSPAKELQEALAKITLSEPLTFNNEYAVECLWHEIMHGRTGVSAKRVEMGVEPIEEGLVQILSRYSYPELLKEMKREARHQDAIIANGLAYGKSAGNLHYLLARAGVDRDNVLSLFFSRQSEAWPLLTGQLAEGLNIKRERVITLLNHAKAKPARDFKEKIEVIIRNAQHRL